MSCSPSRDLTTSGSESGSLVLGDECQFVRPWTGLMGSEGHRVVSLTEWLASWHLVACFNPSLAKRFIRYLGFDPNLRGDPVVPLPRRSRLLKLGRSPAHLLHSLTHLLHFLTHSRTCYTRSITSPTRPLTHTHTPSPRSSHPPSLPPSHGRMASLRTSEEVPPGRDVVTCVVMGRAGTGKSAMLRRMVDPSADPFAASSFSENVVDIFSNPARLGCKKLTN